MAEDSRLSHRDDGGSRPAETDHAAPNSSGADGGTGLRFTEKAWRMGDEEQAREIADRDLNETRKQTYSGFVLLWVAFQATGVVYGDIGTSPLYVFSATFSEHPSHEDLVGALSVIIWALTIIVTLKYTFIVMRADDDGQGGPFALYSLLARHANIIVREDPRRLRKLSHARSRSRSSTDEASDHGSSRGLQRVLETWRPAQMALQVIGVAGVSLVLADGVLTPAQSVLGAVQGIAEIDDSIQKPAIIGISCAVLVLLFALQPLGTARIGTAFAPIVTVWLLFLLCTGIYNLAQHDHTVLVAFSPHHAFNYLIRRGHHGWRSLGGLLLAFTGVEALFADLGAFSRLAIQISWLCLAYPCLLIAYCGQAAFISVDPDNDAFRNPFFKTVPPGSFYFALPLAILAAAVASQAMVTSVFQLLIQVMRMSYFPHITLKHTSTLFHEQVYLPLANWALMIGTIIVVAAFGDTTKLGNAYGACVVLVAFITTCMVALVAIIVWGLSPFVVVPIFLTFAALDGAFLSAALAKVPEGAWATLLIASLLALIFVVWRLGKEAQWIAEAREPLTVTSLLTTKNLSDDGDDMSDEFGDEDGRNISANSLAISQGSGVSPHHLRRRLRQVEQQQQPPVLRLVGGTPVSTVPGLGIFFDKVGDPDLLPTSFFHFVRKFAARPSVIVFFHMRALGVPSIPAAERFVVTRFNGSVLEGEAGENTDPRLPGRGPLGPRAQLNNAYIVVLRHGYADDVLRSDLGRDLVAQLQLSIMNSATPVAPQPRHPDDEEGEASTAPQDREDCELEALREACGAQTVFVLGKEAMRVRRPLPGTGRPTVRSLARRILLEAFLWIRENTRTRLENLDIDMDKLVEVGFVKEI